MSLFLNMTKLHESRCVYAVLREEKLARFFAYCYDDECEDHFLYKLRTDVISDRLLIHAMMRIERECDEGAGSTID